MNKFVLITVALLYFSSNLFAGQPDVKLHEKCLYPTVMVTTVKKTVYGTGTIIRSEKVNDRYKNLFITCAHIFKEGEKYEIISFGYKNWSRLTSVEYTNCEVYALDYDYDLAVGVFFSDAKMPTAEIDINPDIYIGNEVFRIGCGLSSPPRTDFGKVTSIRKSLRTSVFTVPGDSGSALFHQYKIIGIMKSIRMVRSLDAPAFNFSFAIPSWKFKEWSDDNESSLSFIWINKKKMPKLPFLRLEMEEFELK